MVRQSADFYRQIDAKVKGLHSTLQSAAGIHAGGPIPPHDAPPAVACLLPASAASAPNARVAVAPAKPEDMTKFKASLKRVSALYAGCGLVVEDTGEHVVQGPGELFLDAVLYDLGGRVGRATASILIEPR